MLHQRGKEAAAELAHAAFMTDQKSGGVDANSQTRHPIILQRWSEPLVRESPRRAWRHDSDRSPGFCSTARPHRGKASITRPGFCSSFWSKPCNLTEGRIGSGCCAPPSSVAIQRPMRSWPATATWSSQRLPRRADGCWARLRSPKPLSAEERRAVEETLRDRRATRRATFVARYPRVARSLISARRGTRQFLARVPPARRAARFGWKRLIEARHHAKEVQHRVRRQIGRCAALFARRMAPSSPIWRDATTPGCGW